MWRNFPSLRIIRKHHIEPQRTNHITLLIHQRRVLRAQRPGHRDLANTRGNPTRCTINHIAIPRRQRRRWRRRTRARPRLLIVRCLARHRTSINIIPRESELSAAVEDEETRCLQDIGEVEDEVADLALDGVGVELEVEDCAFVVGGDGSPVAGGVGGVGVLGTDGDEGRGGDAVLGEFAVGLDGVGGTGGEGFPEAEGAWFERGGLGW